MDRMTNEFHMTDYMVTVYYRLHGDYSEDGYKATKLWWP
jgi:hypothetical protein